MNSASTPRWLSPRSLGVLAGAFVLCFAAGQLGAAATYPNLSPWYASLAKPWFNPPNLAFPIAWSILYALMAVALWRVAVKANGAIRRQALIAFAVQLACNVAWSFAFFGARSPGLGLVVVLAMFASILWTIVRFRRVDRTAAVLLYPYLAWVGFAAALNAAIFVLNA